MEVEPGLRQRELTPKQKTVLNRIAVVSASCLIAGIAAGVVGGAAEAASLFVDHPEFLRHVVGHYAFTVSARLTPGGFGMLAIGLGLTRANREALVHALEDREERRSLR